MIQEPTVTRILNFLNKVWRKLPKFARNRLTAVLVGLLTYISTALQTRQIDWYDFLVVQFAVNMLSVVIELLQRDGSK